MLPILAESAPHPRRAVAFVVALSIALSFLVIPSHHRPRHREHHQVPRLGQCMQGGYAYGTR
jgi:hypothetical protein